MTEIRKGTFLFHRLMLPVCELKVALSVSLSVHWEQMFRFVLSAVRLILLTANGQIGRFASDLKNVFVQIMLRLFFTFISRALWLRANVENLIANDFTFTRI